MCKYEANENIGYGVYVNNESDDEGTKLIHENILRGGWSVQSRDGYKGYMSTC